jgi:hypothetical protein
LWCHLITRHIPRRVSEHHRCLYSHSDQCRFVNQGRRRVAAHERSCVTKRYDCTGDEITLDEIKRIPI